MKICVIGGGAAGMFAAIFAARAGAEVILLEKNEKLGKKLFITGKGRCNVTNDCEISDFFDNVVHGEKFLRSALYGFPPSATMQFLEEIGLPLVTERGNRVFPFSQKSSDVIKVLSNELERLNVTIKFGTAVKAIKKEEGCFVVLTSWEKIECDKVIVATGGKSYPSTGSTGDGYIFAKTFGHNVVTPVQALSPILTKEDVSALEGISLKNVTLSAVKDGKVIAYEFGEMLFTSRGVSGPIVLSLSSRINRIDGITLSIDLKPALTDEMLDNRIIRDFDERSNQDLKNVTRALMPAKLNTYVLAVAGLSEWKKANSVTKEERAHLVQTLKNLNFTVQSLAPFDEAILTAGGVDTKTLSPSMESRLVEGLFFAGEVVDIDALTGGFNLQLAFSTGVIAAKMATKDLTTSE